MKSKLTWFVLSSLVILVAAAGTPIGLKATGMAQSPTPTMPEGHRAPTPGDALPPPPPAALSETTIAGSPPPVHGTQPGFLPNLDTTLNVLRARWQEEGTSALDQAAAHGMVVDEGRVLVTLTLLDEPSAAAAMAALPNLGAQVTDHYNKWVVALVPIDRLDQVSALSGVAFVQRPTPAPLPEPIGSGSPIAPLSGSYVTQGVRRSNADHWHAAGLTGNGVAIGVIDSFNAQVLNAAYQRGEVPTNVFYGQETPGSAGYHGVAVAEIIHDMAPNASQTLVTPDLNQDFCVSMANTIEGLARAGHSIISSSTGPVQCGAGDGSWNPLATAASDVLHNYNTIFFQAAGNHAQHHYEGYYSYADGWHNFDPTSISVVNPLVVYDQSGQPQYTLTQQGQPLRFYLRWNGGWPQSNQDYDLYLVIWNGAQWQLLINDCSPDPCYSANSQDGSQPPIEAIMASAPYTGYYAVAIYNYAADGTQFMDLLTGHAQPPLLYHVPDRSLVAPAATADAYAVAAVDVTSLGLESYSSWGPTYGPGNEPSGGHAQPQLAGFANVDTWTYLTQAGVPFNGTSAATPHVAGAAALVKAANPCLSAGQLGTFLNNRAVDLGTPGYDYQFGHGALYLGPPTNDLCGAPSHHSTYLPLVSRNYSSGWDFQPNPDGYSFANYGNDHHYWQDDLTVADLIQMFGASQVCVSGSTPYDCVLSAAAGTWGWQMLNAMDGGHCEGMAVTSLRFYRRQTYYTGATTPGDFQYGAQQTFDLTLDPGIENYIAYYFSLQVLAEVADPRELIRLGSTPNDILALIGQNLDSGGSDPYTLGIWDVASGYGHAIVPYAIEAKGGGIYWLYVYDNNLPNRAAYVKFDTNANTWSYAGLGWWGNASTHSITVSPISDRNREPFTPPWAAATTHIQFFLTGGGDLLIANASGQRIGYDPATGQTVNEIPEARIVYLTGTGPLYVLPLQEAEQLYSVTVSLRATGAGRGLAETVSTNLVMVGPGYVAGFEDIQIRPQQKLHMSLSADGRQLLFDQGQAAPAPKPFMGRDDVEQ